MVWSRPDASNNCQLWANIATTISPVKTRQDAIVQVATFEFELKLSNVANIDTTSFFLGLVASSLIAGRTRLADDIIGWGLFSDALQSVTNESGVETVNTGFGETLTNFNKLKVELSYGHAKFFINERQVADHTTNLSALIFMPSFYMATEAGGNATIYLGTNRAWMEDLLR